MNREILTKFFDISLTQRHFNHRCIFML